MKEFSKKISLCFVMLLGVLVMNLMVPEVVWAADSDFVIDENGVLVEYVGLDRNVVIPERVISIGSGAFADCTSITNIIIPKGVVSIGNYAFMDCLNLTDITIPKTVTRIGIYTFQGCSSLTSITIPESITSIGEATFYGCSSLTDIVIPEGVTSIGDYAFSFCHDLKSIIIPDSVTKIGNKIFINCNDLTNITIPSSVISIGESIFQGCEGLKDIHVSSSNMNYKDENGVLFSKDGTRLIAYPAAKFNIDYIIPEGVVNIDNFAFFSSHNLTSIIIPDSVTSIGEWAFNNCYNLTSIIIPDSVTSIGGWAFTSCDTLTSITIPSSVMNIGNCIIEHCKSLKDIHVSSSNMNYKDINGVLFSKDGTELITYPFGKSNTYYTIPEGVTCIGYYAVSNPQLTNIIIPNSVTNIDSGAFYGCSGLLDIIIPNTVTNIGNYAFQSCNKLESIFIYNHNIELGEGICGWNNELVTLYGHKGSTIETYALKNRYNFKELEVLNPSIVSNIVSIHPDKASMIGNNIEVSGNTGIGMNLMITTGSGGKLSVQKGTGIELLRGKSEIEIATGSAIATGSVIELDYLFDIHVDEIDEPQKIVFTLENIIGEVCERIEYMISKKEPETENKPLQSIRLSKTDINLVKDRTSLLKVFYDPEDTTDPRAVTWTSSNREVAIVYTNGKVKAIGKGTAVITAKVGNLTATCNVTVTE